MSIRVTIKNYRCFPDDKPVRLDLSRGFTSLLGVNNAGKSSLLRFFFEFRQLFNSIASYGDLDDAFRGTERAFGYPPQVDDPVRLFHVHNERPILLSLAIDAQDSTLIRQIDVEVKRNTNTWALKSFIAADGRTLPPNRDFRRNDTIMNHGGGVIGNLTSIADAARQLFNSFYIGSFRNILNTGTKEDYFDIAVGQAFVARWRQMQTGRDVNQSRIISGVVEAIEKLFGYDRLEIQASDDNATLQVSINRHPYRLQELGSGIAQFIMVLANVAIRRPAFILIDEPELSLHPSMQLDFLTSLASYATEGTVCATHSIGLARAVSNSIYSVRIIRDGVSEVTDYERTPDLSEFLGSLGFSSYQALGFEKVLLVEGVTEVKAVQQLLRLLKKDHKIVLLPLGGSQMITARRAAELEEIKRITTNIVALIDSERTTAGATVAAPRQAFVTDCGRAGIECHVLERRALENYFTDAAIQKVKGQGYRALGQFENLVEAPTSWSKAEDNWRIAREMTPAELEGTDLWEFLQTV